MALKRERGSSKKNSLCKLAVDKELTIYVIDELKQKFTEDLSLYKKFELNLEAVEEIDTAGIQLLLALKRELMQQKKEFKLTAVSYPVSQLLESYGMSNCFNMEMNA